MTDLLIVAVRWAAFIGLFASLLWLDRAVRRDIEERNRQLRQQAMRRHPTNCHVIPAQRKAQP